MQTKLQRLLMAKFFMAAIPLAFSLRTCMPNPPLPVDLCLLTATRCTVCKLNVPTAHFANTFGRFLLMANIFLAPNKFAKSPARLYAYRTSGFSNRIAFTR